MTHKLIHRFSESVRWINLYGCFIFIILYFYFITLLITGFLLLKKDCLLHIYFSINPSQIHSNKSGFPTEPVNHSGRYQESFFFFFFSSLNRSGCKLLNLLAVTLFFQPVSVLKNIHQGCKSYQQLSERQAWSVPRVSKSFRDPFASHSADRVNQRVKWFT